MMVMMVMMMMMMMMMVVTMMMGVMMTIMIMKPCEAFLSESSEGEDASFLRSSGNSRRLGRFTMCMSKG